MFNMDGAGADGNATPRFAAYGATKRSLQQVRRSACSSLVDDLVLPRRCNRCNAYAVLNFRLQLLRQWVGETPRCIG